MTGVMLPCDGCTTPAPQAATKTYEAKDGQVKLKLDRVLQSLVLVRIGQDLGSDSPAARAVHDLLELLASFPASFLVDKLSR